MASVWAHGIRSGWRLTTLRRQRRTKCWGGQTAFREQAGLVCGRLAATPQLLELWQKLGERFARAALVAAVKSRNNLDERLGVQVRSAADRARPPCAERIEQKRFVAHVQPLARHRRRIRGQILGVSAAVFGARAVGVSAEPTQQAVAQHDPRALGKIVYENWQR